MRAFCVMVENSFPEVLYVTEWWLLLVVVLFCLQIVSEYM